MLLTRGSFHAHFAFIFDDTETELFKKYNKITTEYFPDRPTENDQTASNEAYTLKEVAAILKVTPQTVYNYIKEGKLQTIRMSNSRQRILRAEVDKFLKKEL